MGVLGYHSDFHGGRWITLDGHRMTCKSVLDPSLADSLVEAALASDWSHAHIRALRRASESGWVTFNLASGAWLVCLGK